jgi:hypothetical protein
MLERGATPGSDDIGARMDLSRHDIDGGVAARPEHEAIGAAAAGESANAMKVRLSSLTSGLGGLRLEDPEVGEAGELLAGGRSDADGKRAGRDAIDLALADGAEIRAALEDSEFIADAGLSRLGDGAPA